jgi:hypothetical protein
MQAIRTGRHMGRGRQILPPMPFAMYRNFTDEDLGAIYCLPAQHPADQEPRARAAAARADQCNHGCCRKVSRFAGPLRVPSHERFNDLRRIP